MSYNNGTNIWVIIGYIYLIISQFMAIYFWWQWANENSFLSSILVGPVVGEIKGLLWIFFVW
ncbi:MAG: hypothetical protein KA463_02625 [Flavobacterium sp.]|jgi:hypothetical protein|uniref:hypothetical protein n=1 Tax=Flavobacterium sp. TaxID=239 RepID=UPI001B60DD7F|nr:hypothetical protein [Flavobacterium sp.]MBP6146069.1 hypothetical protein [Flavobacterium sp.]MBP7182623.1 hypothetical protein [Flavobacterium sp.]MBP7317139.1 hypothetical protein [Flavobacterium sp.]MBP8887122.1 hypothetical protein [Flavobacterium sp.]HRL70223.1 hypothetical protein [Flavobacterium sp.]